MRHVVASVTLLVCLGAGAGCDQPNHRAAVAQRQENLRAMTATLQSIERERPENMRGTVAMLKDQNKHDQEQTRANARGVDRAIKDEFRNWRELQPAYRHSIEGLMQGDPGSIDRTIPLILY